MSSLFVLSIVARLPLAMLTIGILVHAKTLTGSFVTAGATAGALAVAQGVGGPLLGRVVDRRGQTGVLAGSAIVAAAALAGLAALRHHPPSGALIALAALAGFATPPVAACMRTLYPAIVDADALPHAYAVDSAAVELTWISGPPLVLACGAALSTGAALLGAAAVLVASTLAFAAAPASRAWQPASRAEAPGAGTGGGALTSPGVRTLALVLVGAGLLFGATEVAVTAAADGLGHTAAAGPLLGLWGLGGFIGGLAAATRYGGDARTGGGLALLLAALAAGHMAPALFAGSVVTLGGGMVLAGTMIAPTCATAYAMIDAVAPEGTVTEAFAWMATAVAIGSSLGAAMGGVVADKAGATPTFVLAGGAAAVVAVIAALRAGTLDQARVSSRSGGATGPSLAH